MVIDEMKQLLATILQIPARTSAMNASTRLLGSLPELDSMAVVSLITAIEERFGIPVEDDEIAAETFATLGTLTAFVEHKLGIDCAAQR